MGSVAEVAEFVPEELEMLGEKVMLP